jgi:hypothetical protein
VRSEPAAIREELKRIAAELREHTSTSVREVAEAELRMRLSGVVFVMAGIVFAYLASLA